MGQHRSREERVTVPSRRCVGTVQSFDKFCGNGTIIMQDGCEVRVRYSAIRGQGKRNLNTGSHVSFTLEQRRHGLYAVCVQEE